MRTCTQADGHLTMLKPAAHTTHGYGLMVMEQVLHVGASGPAVYARLAEQKSG